MLQIAAHARLGKELGNPGNPERHRNGNSISRRYGWGLVAFGKMADTLMRHKKCDLLSLQGKATQSVWTDRTTGEERSRLSVNMESIVSARTARPCGRKKASTLEAQSMQTLSGKKLRFQMKAWRGYETSDMRHLQRGRRQRHAQVSLNRDHRSTPGKPRLNRAEWTI